MRALSHVFSNMLGSVGGITYLNNPFHQIVGRQRTVPVQPNTDNQVLSKTAFSAAVQAWEQATDQVRADWKAFAQTVTFQGPLGPYSPTGRMLAVAQYQITGYLLNREVAGFIGGNDMQAPVDPGMLIITNPTVGPPLPPGTGFSIGSKNDNGESVVAYAERSFKQSAARNFYKGPWVSPTLNSLNIDDTDTEFLNFMDLIEGGIYFVKLRYVSAPLGRRYSQEVILRVVAETTV
jgi:hypothetical protein